MKHKKETDPKITLQPRDDKSYKLKFSYHKTPDTLKDKPQHTPTPWYLYGNEVRTCPTFNHDSVDSDELVGAFEQDSFSEADAAFIERAVNCHEELVALLKDMIDYEETYSNLSWSEVVAKAKQTIAKAEGK